MSLLFEEQTAVLRRCFYDVQNEVGLGRQEEAYHQACLMWLEGRGVPIASRRPHHLMLGDRIAHALFPDITAWDEITVELKAVPRRLARSEFVQLFDYLKCRGDRLGLLVNLGLDRVHVDRVVYDPPEYDLRENWDYWSGRISGREREVGAELRAMLGSIFAAHQTGYGEEVTQSLIVAGLKQHGLSHVIAPSTKAYFRGCQVDDAPLDCLVVEGCMLLVYTALFDNNQFNISRGLSFLQALGLTWGIAANFGRRTAEFTGLCLGV